MSSAARTRISTAPSTNSWRPSTAKRDRFRVCQETASIFSRIENNVDQLRRRLRSPFLVWALPGMLKLSMSRFGSPRRVARLAAYLFTGVLLGAVPVLAPHAYARQQDTGFLNR